MRDREVDFGLQWPRPRYDKIVEIELVLSFRGDLNVEQHLHRRFADLREHGEWFRVEEPLSSFISEMKRRQRLSA